MLNKINRMPLRLPAKYLGRAMLTLVVSLTAAGVCHAAPKDLQVSDYPLEIGIAPEPNVLIIADDSGSMDWEIVVEQDSMSKQNSLDGITISGDFFAYANLFGYRIPFTLSYPFDNLHIPSVWAGRVAPTYKAVVDRGLFYSHRSAMLGIWRVRNPQYNLIYYNPEVRYDPWIGYPPSNPADARVDPNLNKTVMLTRNQTSLTTNNITVIFPDGRYGTDDQDMALYLPFYYTWQPSSANDTYIDANECGELVEIKPGAVRRDCYGNSLGGSVFPMPKSPERTDCAALTTCTAAEELQNFANWFTYYRRREFVATAALSNVVSSLTGVRLGYMTLNGASYPASERPRYPITNNTNHDELLKHIFNTRASEGGTPLLTALDDAGKYFSCQSNSGMGNFSCPRTYSTARECQRNYTLMVTDGFWDSISHLWTSSRVTTSLPQHADNDSDTNSPFSGGVFADNNRSGSSSNQWLTLADVAMYYFKTDLDPGAANEVIPSKLEKARMADPTYFDRNPTMHQHMNTFTVGFGIFNDPATAVGKMDPTGLWVPPPMNTTVNWPRLRRGIEDTNKLEDLKHAAFNGRGLFATATGIKSLVNNLRYAFSTIQEGVGAVAAASFNSQELSEGSVVYAASYDTSNGSGDLVAYRVNPETGAISTAANNVVWRASSRLQAKISENCNSPSDTRTILSYRRDATPRTGVALSAVSNHLSDAQAKWVRGHKAHEISSGCSGAIGLRDRERPQGLIGDIVHSRPLFVGKPSFKRRDGAGYPSGEKSYSAFQQQVNAADRMDMVMVGANDGLFHVFNAANGDEVMAYAPSRLVQGGEKNSKIASLTDSTYSHKYYVDLSPAVNDVYIRPRAGGARAWSTVAVGGYRAGGRGYFALDMTDPGAFASQSTGAARVMWEFSDLDDKGLGLTFSPPLLTLTNEPHEDPAEGNKWRALFGNGYNSDDGIARLFLLDIEGGYGGWTKDTNYLTINASAAPANNGIKNGLGVPRGVDVDENGTVDYVYAGDLEGNLYRFDLTSPTGQFFAVRIFTASSSTGKRQPITTQPLVVRHPEDPESFIVVFTTGSWMTQEDARSTDVQSIYAISDTPKQGTNSTAYGRSLLQPRWIKNVNDAGITRRVIVGNELAWSNTVKGWYMDLSARAVGISPTDAAYATSPVMQPGERAVRNMVMRGGYIFVNTLFPSAASSCSAALGGSVMTFNPVSGLLDKAIFDFNGDGVFDTLAGEPIAGTVTGASLSDSAMIGDRLVYQESSAAGVITPRSIKTNTNQETIKGRLSWKELK